MDLASKKLYIHASEALSPIESPPTSHFGSSSHTSHASFPIIAVAIIGILATAFLLVSYYIFVIKCCLNWHRIDILRRFSFSRRRRAEETLVIFHSPVVVAENRGLNEAAIRSIPIFKFKKNESFNAKSCECAVCLNEFQEEEKLRVIPNCAHVFHIDCIDVWLQNNANCPLCRTSISSNRLGAQYNLDQTIIPTQSPRDQTDNFTGRDEDYVVIEIGTPRNPVNSNSGELLTNNLPPPRRMEPIRVSQKRAKKFSHVSSKGDECIDNRQKDERFLVQPMRRSFSMDSGADSQLNLAVQEIIQRHREEVNVNNDDLIISPNEGCSRLNKRSFFSFGQGKSSSRSAVQPVALD